MAASMLRVRCRMCLPKHVIQAVTTRTAGQYKKLKFHDSFFYAIPNDPEDTPETNEMLRWNEYPQFSKVKPSKVFTGSAKASIDYEVEVAKHVDWLEESQSEPKSFDEVYLPLEKVTQPLNYIQATTEQVMRSGTDPRKSYEHVHDKMMQRRGYALNYRWLQPNLYNEFARLEKNPKQLSQAQQRVVEKLRVDGMFYGPHFTGVEHAIMVADRNALERETTTFVQNVENSKFHFRPKVEDPRVVQSLSPWLQKQISVNKADYTRPPWLVSLDDDICEPFIAQCINRKEREKVWLQRKETSSALQNELHLSNSLRVNDIIYRRNDYCRTMGYSDHVDMVMSINKMATSADEVLSFLASLIAVYKDVAKEEIAKLQEYAGTRGLQDKLQWWDVPFFRRQLYKEKYKADEHDVSDYFEYSNVMQKLMEMCSKLFGITFTNNTASVEVWHEDVQFYTIKDKESGEEYGSFYLDPFSRDGKLDSYAVRMGRERCAISDAKPFVYMSYSLGPRIGQQPIEMALFEIENVFAMFGQMLQQIVTKAPYMEVHGKNYMEEDVEFLIPTLFQMIANNKCVLKSMSSHYNDKSTIPDSLLDSVLEGKNFFIATNLVEEMMLASFDFEIHLQAHEKAWQDVYDPLFESCMPLPKHRLDFTPASMVTAFGYPQGCISYIPIWTKMVASDLYSVFEKVGFEDLDKLSEVGKRFKEHYLLPGSVVLQRENFRQFVGRDPAINNYIERYKSILS